MKKVSFIVPVYNTEKYLEKCLESIINQTYNNIEIVIVNDGSTDNSINIIKKYAEKFKFIKFFTKQNGGLSDARNYGVKKATGDYIIFVDSDDYIEENLINHCLKYILESYDLIKFKAQKVDEDYNFIEKYDGPVFEKKNGEEAFNELFVKDNLIEPAWLYMYKMDFWKSNKFEYPIGKIHEDFARTLLIILKAKSVASIDYFGYNYVQSKKSIIRSNNHEKKMKSALDLIYHYNHMLNEIKGYNLSEKTVQCLKAYYTNCILLKTLELNKKNRREYIKIIKKKKLIQNIKVTNIRQLIKKIILKISIQLYLKIR